MLKVMGHFFLGLVWAVPAAEAGTDHKRAVPIVVAQVNVSRQTLYLSVDGWPTGTWPVSTAGMGYHTPRGSFSIKRLERIWFSRKYDNSPMPYSIFFDGGIAIHGSDHIRSLGKPVSHGCVRLHPDNAARLFSLVQHYGAARSRVIVTD